MTTTASQHGKGRWALITGASSGIGTALAREFASHGFATILVARREARLRTLAGELADELGVEALALPGDLADPSTPQRLFDELTARAIHVDALVNNAGYGLGTGFSETPWQTHADFLQVLAFSVTHLCHLFVPGMKARGYGRILNVASMAAFTPDPAGNLYPGVKSYVVHLSRALDVELRRHGVYCTALCPGFTRSEFHEIMGVASEVGRLPGPMWMHAEEVARQGYEAVMEGDPVLVPGRLNQALVGLLQLVPQSLQHRITRWYGRSC